MPGIRIQIKNLKLINDKLQQMDNSVSVPLLKRVLFESIDIIRKEALAILKSQTTRSSKLHPGWIHIEDALRSQAGKSDVYASAFAKVINRLAPQARWLEFGHRLIGHKPNRKDSGQRTLPRPFFRPAVDAKRTEVRNKIKDGIAALLAGKSPFAPANSIGNQGQYTDVSGDFRN